MRSNLRICLVLTAALVLGCTALVSANPPKAMLENAIGLPADIVFDTYCDGAHLEAGPHGSVAGVQTGCVAEPITGAPGPRGGINYAVNEHGSLHLYVIRPDNTWIIFDVGGGNPTVVNSGTWSYGTPLAANAGLRPSGQR